MCKNNTFYIYIHTDILLSIFPLTPFLTSLGASIFCKCCYSSNCNYQYGQVAPTSCSKNHSVIFAVLFSETIIPGIWWGQDKDAVKWHFKEQCTWYNCTLFVWVIFWDQKKLTVMLNHCTWGRLMKVSLYPFYVWYSYLISSWLSPVACFHSYQLQLFRSNSESRVSLIVVSYLWPQKK